MKGTTIVSDRQTLWPNDGDPLPAKGHHFHAAMLCSAWLLIAAGISYSSWALAWWLNPGVDVRDGYLSELSAADQPNHLAFVGADAATAVLVLTALTVIVRSRPPFEIGAPRSTRLLMLSGALFGISTLADAALPLSCSPYGDTTCALLERSNNLPLSHQLHSVTSTLAVTAALCGMSMLAVAAPRIRHTTVALTVIAVASVVASLAAMLTGAWLGVAQRVEVASVGIWLILLGVVVARRGVHRGSHSSADVWTMPGKQICVGSGSIHVVSDGTGEPTVVLEPGLGGAWLDFDSLVARLTDSHQTVRIDPAGLGMSSRQSGRRTLHREADRIAAVIDTIGLVRPVIVGFSMGAMHVEAFARYYPDRLCGLVLLDPSCETAIQPRRLLCHWLSGVGQALSPLVAGAGAAAGLLRLLGPRLRNRAARAMTTTRTAPGSAGQLRAVYGRATVAAAVLAQLIAYRDIAAELVELRGRRPLPGIPVTIVTGLSDGNRDWHARHDELARILGARHVVLAEAGHLVHVDRPDRIAAEIDLVAVPR